MNESTDTTSTSEDLASSDRAGSHEPSRFQAIQGDHYSGVILPAEISAEHWRFSTGRVPEAHWLADAASIHKLETQLAEHFKGHDDVRAHSLADKLGDYKRQYLSVVDQGARQIELRGICQRYIEEHQVDWQGKVIQVDDGGDCFFDVTYDVDQDKISRLSIHSGS